MGSFGGMFSVVGGFSINVFNGLVDFLIFVLGSYMVINIIVFNGFCLGVSVISLIIIVVILVSLVVMNFFVVCEGDNVIFNVGIVLGEFYNWIGLNGFIFIV